MATELNQKQETFVLEYFKTGNAGQSALKAGYSPKTASVIASENLTKPKIIARLAELQGKVEGKTIATVQERKEILTEIIRAKLPDYMQLGADGSWVNIGPETPNGRAIQEIHSRTEYDKDGNCPTIYTSVKLINPIEAIKELNKMEKVYDDATKVNVSLDQRQLTIQVVDKETQELLARVQNGDTLAINNSLSGQPESLPQQETPCN